MCSSDLLEELQSEYSPSAFFKGIFYTLLPQRILLIFGIDKTELYTKDGIGSDWIVARVTRGITWGGVRPGMIGQSLMAFGIGGMIVIFIGYGVLFSYLDRFIKENTMHSSSAIYVYLVAILFSISMLTSTQSLFSKFWFYTYIYLLIRFVGSKKIIQ